MEVEEPTSEQNEPVEKDETENVEMKEIDKDNVENNEKDYVAILNEKEKHYFEKKEVVELAKITISNTTNQHYFQGTTWSSDGTCLLTAVNAKGLMIFELPQDIYGKETISKDRDINVLKPVINVKCATNIYDFCFNPVLNSMDDTTTFFIASCQNEPIKLYDAFNGNYKSSYRVYDYADELDAALSVCFSPDGSLIYGGMKKGIVVFNTSVPGRDYDTIPLKQATSCMASNYYSSEIAAGSWNKTISLIDSRDYLVTDTLNGHKQGVTYLKFSSNGDYLISGSRKDSNLLMWDMRNRSLPLYRFTRRVDTNQKVQFDISYNSNWLISGDTRGIVHAWSLFDLDENEFPKENQYQLHNDACSGISVHPYLPVLATSSGQFKYGNDIDDAEKTEEIIENSLVLWWIGSAE